MKISIIALTYNHGKYIIDFLNSVKYQVTNYNNDKRHFVQLIVSDDCSKDDTVQRVEKWKMQNGDCIDDFVIAKNNENIGTCRNYLNALEICTGDYVKAIGGDDMLPETSIFTIAQYLDHYDMVFGVPFVYYEGKSNDVSEILRTLRKVYCIQKEENRIDYYDLIHRHCFINGPATYVSKRLLTDKRVTDFLASYKYTDDYPQWLIMSKIKDVRFIAIPMVSVVYRRTNKSAYVVKNDELLAERIRSYQYALDTCKTMMGRFFLRNRLKNMDRIKRGEKPHKEALSYLHEFYRLKNRFTPSPYTKELVEYTIKYIEEIKKFSVV